MVVSGVFRSLSSSTAHVKDLTLLLPFLLAMNDQQIIETISSQVKNAISSSMEAFRKEMVNQITESTTKSVKRSISDEMGEEGIVSHASFMLNV